MPGTCLFAIESSRGVWSVQVLQHLPREILDRVLVELRRTLRPNFGAEVYNLNPDLLNLFACRVLGRALYRRGEMGPFHLDLLAGEEWRARLALLVSGEADRLQIGYSELFFHPRLRIRPPRYPLALERLFLRIPGIARLIARQVHVSVALR